MFIIKKDNLEDIEIQKLISHHLNGMKKNSPEKSVHALDLNQLRSDDVTFWSIWKSGKLTGCGTLKELDPVTGEIKSLRTHESFLRQGVAERLLKHIIDIAKTRGYIRLYLETGSSDSFKPAHRLYKKYGFIECPPFGDYKEDPFSLFMTLYMQ